MLRVILALLSKRLTVFDQQNIVFLNKLNVEKKLIHKVLLAYQDFAVYYFYLIVNQRYCYN